MAHHRLAEMTSMTTSRFNPDSWYGPFREVTSVTFLQSKFAKPGCGSAEVKLSCGHTTYRKWSKAPTYKARCLLCAST